MFKGSCTIPWYLVGENMKRTPKKNLLGLLRWDELSSVETRRRTRLFRRDASHLCDGSHDELTLIKEKHENCGKPKRPNGELWDGRRDHYWDIYWDFWPTFTGSRWCKYHPPTEGLRPLTSLAGTGWDRLGDLGSGPYCWYWLIQRANLLERLTLDANKPNMLEWTTVG